MLILISPAKTMSGTSNITTPEVSLPRFQNEANEIARNMLQFSKEELEQLFKINSKLAAENYIRYQEFHSEDKLPLQAVLAYTGVVFKNMNPKDFTKEDFLYAQDHLRMASFCYGLLRPLDVIKPYRMEFTVKLPELGDGNMYHYWRSRQTRLLLEDTKAAGGTLIYLASMDIQPAFDWKKVERTARVIIPEFKVWKNGKPNTIVIYAKMARGQMSRYILKNRISNPEDLKSFAWEGFHYNEKMSEGNRWIFMQE